MNFPSAASYALAIALSILSAPLLAQTPTAEDLEALRFYLSEDNQAAVNSEIRRLQLQYPDWEVPDDFDDLGGNVPGEMIDRIYQQIAAGNFGEARSSIADIAREYPGWSPSTELLEDLSISEAQDSFDQALAAGNSAMAIGVAQRNPGLLRCERINNAWLLAEQYELTGDTDAAISLYTGIAQSCTDSDLLIATLEKAASIASLEELSHLANLARQQAPGAADRLSSVESRLRAGLVAQGQMPQVEITPPLGPAFDRGALAGTSPERSLRPVGRPQRASSQPSPVRNRTHTAPSGSLAQARSAAERGDWLTCLAMTEGSRDPETIGQRGWCAMNADRPMEALSDFRDAANRAPTSQGRRDASYGQALVLLRLNMVDQAATVAASTHFTPEQRREIEGQILDKRGVSAYNRRDYARAIAYFDELERITGVVRRDLAMLRGYAYLNSGKKARARAEFQKLHDQMATSESRRALSEAMR